MAFTAYQLSVLRELSLVRIGRGDSYIAGGAALNHVLGSPRRSHDLDLFHDTSEALAATWRADREQLDSRGYRLETIRETPTFVEAIVARGTDTVIVQWARDSAFRFFPLVADPTLGLTLHPFDLATNKILAMAGRLEPRDWIDSLSCHRALQHLAYLAWASCGKDPGVNPELLLSHARSIRYAQAELDALAWDDRPPNVSALSAEWKSALDESMGLIELLPDEHLGTCLLRKDSGELYRGSTAELNADLAGGRIAFHRGTIGGVLPSIAA